MEFEITLYARSDDEGGIVASFNAQLEELGAITSEIVSQVIPYKVTSTNGAYYFESQRTYNVTI